MESPNLVALLPTALLLVDYKFVMALKRLLILTRKCICKTYQWSCCTILAFFIRAVGAKMTGRPPDWTRGRSLGRSQSLLNMRSGPAPMTEDVHPGNRSNSSTAVQASSEEEGLELLGTAATRLYVTGATLSQLCQSLLATHRQFGSEDQRILPTFWQIFIRNQFPKGYWQICNYCNIYFSEGSLYSLSLCQRALITFWSSWQRVGDNLERNFAIGLHH
jgi:hypothetical protein